LVSEQYQGELKRAAAKKAKKEARDKAKAEAKRRAREKGLAKQRAKQQQAAQKEAKEEKERVFTLAELERHSFPDLGRLDDEPTGEVEEASLLLAVHGVVYDVRAFVSKHPGGWSHIRRWAGKDATQAFKGSVVSSIVAHASLRRSSRARD
jgi:cytochrome b involved in lipid metabolism